MTGIPKDNHGRVINYLRLSVTDRCNLRCTYCMPEGGVPKLGHGDILSFEDLLRISEAAIDVGVEKIRVTGGEPLVRKGVTNFLERLAHLPGLKRLVLTTNGILLKELAGSLKSAGVQSLNISLDSLRQDRFEKITRGGRLADVLEGIDAAEKAGFSRIKINMVVMRGINDDEVAEFAALSIRRSFQVRFIEYMPTLQEDGWTSLSVPGEELLASLSREHRLQRQKKESLAGPATCYQIEGAAGSIGFITPVSCHFCTDCNRIRVTSTGFAKSCLFSTHKTDLRPFLLQPDNSNLRHVLRSVIAAKPDPEEIRGSQTAHDPLPMSQVGG